MSGVTHYTELYIRVTDKEALLEAAANHLVATKVHEHVIAAREDLAGDVEKALSHVIDPGLTIPGVEIDDCVVETVNIM